MTTRGLSGENALTVLKFIVAKPELVWDEVNNEALGCSVYGVWLRTEFEGKGGVFSTFQLGWTVQPDGSYSSASLGGSYGHEYLNYKIELINNRGDSAAVEVNMLPDSKIKERILKGIELIQQQYKELTETNPTKPIKTSFPNMLGSRESRKEYKELIEKMNELDFLA